VVAAANPAGVARARSLLWICARLAAWGQSVGLSPVETVLLAPSTIERFVLVGMAHRSAAARRTARTNLRHVARRLGVAGPPDPAPLARSRAKAPYSSTEVEALFALAAAQPARARRQQLVGLLCLGLGAGIEREDLRHITGNHVVCRSGGVVVIVEGRRPRVVPVLARYHAPLLGAARHAGSGYVCGGSDPHRRNLTANLLGRIDGDAGVRLEVGRLRASWLCEQIGRLGVPALLAAAGISCSQHLGDIAAHLAVPDEDGLVALLG